jgi:photosystem II stability/assembly factor-like uncharacterized protein
MGDDTTTLLVGTRKGLFRAMYQSGAWHLDGPKLAGYEINHTCGVAGLAGRFYAATGHPVWGAHIYRSDDYGATWRSLKCAPHHDPGTTQGPALRSLWHLAATSDGSVLYAGIDPAGLFASPDEGASWQPLRALNEHPTRNTWEPARGGFSLHSICIDPADPQRLFAAVSAGGVYRSEDGGASWETANAGVRAEHLPQRYPASGHNVHRLIMHPLRSARLYRQCYNGTYRSDDGGRNWTEITSGLPSDFGYAIVADPNDADTVFVVPAESTHMRSAVDGRLRVYRSRDAGANWQALTRGLPQEHAYQTVLREAMDADARTPCGLYMGTSGGHLFSSRDAGESWQLVAGYLPRILSVKVVP